MISEVKPLAITIPGSFGRTRAVLLTGSCAVVAVAVASGSPTRGWQAPSLAAYFAAVSLVTALLIYRGWRTRVRFDGDGLTIRHFFGTRRHCSQRVGRLQGNSHYPSAAWL